jgi:aminoglycoside phosphotransferase (APT) family kinase protein
MATAPTPTVDYTSTARRPGWAELPAQVRAAIVGRIGTVTGAVGAGGGFTPAFAATLTTASGDRSFLKAADLDTEFGQSIAREAAVVTLLPPGLPVPLIRWHASAAGYAVACFDAIDGRMPGQPWTQVDLALALDAHAILADALATPSPQLVDASNDRSFSEHSAAYVDSWRRVRDGRQPMPDAPHVADHLSELAELEATLPQVTAGAVNLMHFDLRPDNVLIASSGEQAVVLDWNWIRPGRVHSEVGCDLRVLTWLGDTPGRVLASRRR